VVVEIDARRFASAAIPSENETPLLVDADRMKFGQLAAQLFEMVAWGARVSPDRSSSINNGLSKSDGIFRDRTSSTKKARSQSSRKSTIIIPP